MTMSTRILLFFVHPVLWEVRLIGAIISPDFECIPLTPQLGFYFLDLLLVVPALGVHKLLVLLPDVTDAPLQDHAAV